MGEAHYRIAIPGHDNLKQPLSKNLPLAVHHWLHASHPRLFRSGWIEGPHRGTWQHDLEEPMHHYNVVTQDTPETDSYVKQAAAHVGNLANQLGTHVIKTGKGGVQSWFISNPKHVDSVGASPGVLEAPLAPSSIETQETYAKGPQIALRPL